MFKIKISYLHTDPNNYERHIEELDGSWRNITVISENITRIKTHYYWYDVKYIQSWNCPHRNVIEPPVFVIHYNPDDPVGSILLLTDDNVEYAVYPFWIGTHKTLLSVQVVMDTTHNLMLLSDLM